MYLLQTSVFYLCYGHVTDSPELRDLLIVLLRDLGEVTFPLRIYISSSEKRGAGLDDPLHLLLYAADGEWIA